MIEDKIKDIDLWIFDDEYSKINPIISIIISNIGYYIFVKKLVICLLFFFISNSCYAVIHNEKSYPSY